MTDDTNPRRHDVTTDRIVRPNEAAKIVGAHRLTLYRWMKQGRFPATVKLGPQSVGWRLSDLEAWLSERGPGGGQPSGA